MLDVFLGFVRVDTMKISQRDFAIQPSVATTKEGYAGWRNKSNQP